MNIYSEMLKIRSIHRLYQVLKNQLTLNIVSYINNNCFHCYKFQCQTNSLQYRIWQSFCLIIFSTRPELTGHVRTKYLALIRTRSWLIPAGNLLIHTLNLCFTRFIINTCTGCPLHRVVSTTRGITDTPLDLAPANTSQNDHTKADRNSKWAQHVTGQQQVTLQKRKICFNQVFTWINILIAKFSMNSDEYKLVRFL